MTKIEIFSGFLGGGKTTLIKKLIKEAFAGEKLVLIENEFGEIGVDGGFMKEAGIEVTEMSQGCICCSLVGDFGRALKKVIAEYAPERILIEPSGVGKLSDVIRAVQNLGESEIVLNSFTTVVDAKRCKMYMKNFGEFFLDQVEHANSVIFSRTQDVGDDKLEEAVAMLREHNGEATFITTPWDELDGKDILEAMEHRSTLETELALLAEEDEHEHHHHHDDDDDDDDECECGHHHHHHDDDDDDDEDEHEHHHHHHHDDDDDDDEDEHEHHHHHHHHGHDADEVFVSWGKETPKKFTAEFISSCLDALGDEGRFGIVVRAKGIVASADGKWIHFDYVPEEKNVRFGTAEVTGRLCVIGSKLNEDALGELFGV
ncbi:MAG: GTP-binding protein [Clostridia bacterium]|nr:GTP-binding protein [Clostridia bacterium]